MASGSTEIANQARRALRAPELHLDLRAEWGATAPRFREAIRAGALAWLEARNESGAELDAVAREAILSLAAPPHSALASISISHTNDFGGFAAVPGKTSAVGLDIELESRIKAEITRRISTPEEFVAEPMPGYLWVAKEAAFKALDRQRGLVVTLVSIGGWRKDGDSHSFVAKAGTDSARGVVFKNERRLIAVVISP